jgi:hypothetical protein
VTTKTTAITIGAAIAALYFWRGRLSGGRLVPSVTTSEGFDLSPYGGPTTYPEPIKRFAQAIAKAEGFYVAGSIPQRANNPGDLKMINWDGPTLGEGISVFQSVDAGWSALYRQLYLILSGQSGVYNLDMTIAQMGAKWTATQQSAWASNVAGYLAVSPSTPLWSVLA